MDFVLVEKGNDMAEKVMRGTDTGEVTAENDDVVHLEILQCKRFVLERL